MLSDLELARPFDAGGSKDVVTGSLWFVPQDSFKGFLPPGVGAAYKRVPMHGACWCFGITHTLIAFAIQPDRTGGNILAANLVPRSQASRGRGSS